MRPCSPPATCRRRASPSGIKRQINKFLSSTRRGDADNCQEGQETGSQSSKLQSHRDGGRVASGRGGFTLKLKACEAEAWQLLCWPLLMGDRVGTEHQVLRAHIRGRHCPSSGQDSCPGHGVERCAGLGWVTALTARPTVCHEGRSRGQCHTLQALIPLTGGLFIS